MMANLLEIKLLRLLLALVVITGVNSIALGNDLESIVTSELVPESFSFADSVSASDQQVLLDNIVFLFEGDFRYSDSEFFEFEHLGLNVFPLADPTSESFVLQFDSDGSVAESFPCTECLLILERPLIVTTQDEQEFDLGQEFEIAVTQPGQFRDNYTGFLTLTGQSNEGVLKQLKSIVFVRRPFEEGAGGGGCSVSSSKTLNADFTLIFFALCTFWHFNRRRTQRTRNARSFRS